MDSDPESCKTLLHNYHNHNQEHHHHHHQHHNQQHPHIQHHHHLQQQHSPHHHHPHRPNQNQQVKKQKEKEKQQHQQQQKQQLPEKPGLMYPATSPTPLIHKPDPSSSSSPSTIPPKLGLTNSKTYAAAAAAGITGVGYSETVRLQQRVARLTSCLYGLIVTVVVGGILLTAVIAALYAKLYYDLSNHSHQPKVGEQISKILEREELCVPCREIRLGPSPDEEAMLNVFTKRASRNGQNCCVERPTELLRLLELYIEKRYRQEMAKGNIKIRHSSTGSRGSRTQENAAAAHMMGHPQRQELSQVPGSQIPIGQWIHREDLAFAHHVTYRHGRIVVPDDGLYYVYSQVAFLEVLPVGRGASALNHGTESSSLSHYLYRYNIIYPNGGEEKLVQNSITKCWGPNKAFGEYTSYLGAVFHLRQGDEVFVKVSNITMMARDPKSNYFGLFKV